MGKNWLAIVSIVLVIFIVLATGTFLVILIHSNSSIEKVYLTNESIEKDFGENVSIINASKENNSVKPKPNGGGGGGGDGGFPHTEPEENKTNPSNGTVTFPLNFNVHSCANSYNKNILKNTSNTSCDFPFFCSFSDRSLSIFVSIYRAILHQDPSMPSLLRCTDGLVGSLCTNNSDCFSNFCDNKAYLCKSNGSIGTGCSSKIDCSPELVCNSVNYTCSTGAVGENCKINNDCQSNLFCDNFRNKCTDCTSCKTFPEGSLGKDMQDEIQTRVLANGYNNTQFVTPYGGWTAGTGSPTLLDNETGLTTNWTIYHTWGNYYTRTIIRNPNNTLKDVDLSCVSIVNDAQGKNQQAGTLLTKKHFVLADHYSIQNGFNVGTKVTFMGMNNQVYVGTVTKTAQINNSDIRLYELTEEVPDYIVPCQIMSPSWISKMPYRLGDLENPYIFFIDQRKNIVLSEMGANTGLLGTFAAQVYSASGIMWDSGSPVMALIHKRPVLLFTFTGSWGGPQYSDYISQIQDQINAWGSSNQLDIVDLSGFVDY